MSELRTARGAARRALAVLAVLAYVPMLASHPGRMPADTKLGLTLNPARLMSTAVRSWDTTQFAGWVPHQVISFIWPAGPFYWLGERLGLSPWVTQRLWVGTILFAAGAGVWWFARRSGHGVAAAFAAAVIYQTSPYILPYVSRTSLMLLPWAGLGWLMGLARRAAEPADDRGQPWWRRAWVAPTALFALLLATVGSVNLTATLMIAPAPVLVLADMARQRVTTWARVALTAVRIGAVSLVVSLWWMAMLATQGRYGAKVLGYSETLQSVSTTTTAPEVLRGMGYWLAYVHAPSGTTTTAATPYMTSPALILVGAALLVTCLCALLMVQFAHRALCAAMLLIGTVLAVGVHPIDDASPLMSGIASASRSTLALSLRSSTRAIPLIAIALALCAAALIDACAPRAWKWRVLVAPGLVALSLLNMPALFNGGMVDPALLHDQQPPAEWYTAADTLDDGSADARVLQLPGVESQVFAWGYTVDPPLPSLTTRQVITRDWLPLGTPSAMDFFYAIDDRFQNGTAEPAALAPLARFLGVDTIWLARDADSQRFASASADDVEQVVRRSTDVEASGVDGSHVALYRVADPVAITRASTRVVVLFGSGEGIVDAAAAGLLRGDEAVLYAADLDDAELTHLARDGALFIVTDSNRDRGRQWRGAQDGSGFTESGGPNSDLLRLDPQDARLPVFTTEAADDQTISQLDGGLLVQATSYGSALANRPEFRPALAVDGDPDTSWQIGIDGGPVVGEQIRLHHHDGALRIVQADTDRRITRIGIAAGGRYQSVELDASSTRPTGQMIDATVAGATNDDVTITIEAVEGTSGPVGFAELIADPRHETIRVPVLRGPAEADSRYALVVTRERRAAAGRPPIEPEFRRAATTPALSDPQWTVTITGSSAEAKAGCSSDLLTIDGEALPLMITPADVATLASGDSATVHACSPAPLSAAPHVLVGASGDLQVDRIVVADAAPTAGAATDSAPVVRIDRGRDTHHVTVSECPDGCWLIFGEGYSTGWSASSNDATVGRHVAISGGFNGWWVQPAGSVATITLHWSGQRSVDLSMAVSAGAVVLLAGAAFAGRRRQRFVASTQVSQAAFDPLRRQESTTVAWVAAISTVLTIALVVSPKWAVLTLPVPALTVLLRRTRLAVAAGLVLIAGAYAALVAVVVHFDHPAAFDWPLHGERLHRPVLAAVVMLAIGAIATASSGRAAPKPAQPTGDAHPGDGEH